MVNSMSHRFNFMCQFELRMQIVGKTLLPKCVIDTGFEKINVWINWVENISLTCVGRHHLMHWGPAWTEKKKKKDWGPVNFSLFAWAGTSEFSLLLELEHPSFPALRRHGHSWFLGLWIWNGIYATGSSGSWVHCCWTEKTWKTLMALYLLVKREWRVHDVNCS